MPSVTINGAAKGAHTFRATTAPGCRLYGSAKLSGIVYWYHPPSDLLVRADLWLDIVGDPDAPEPAAGAVVD